jgi:hypothetical protein
MVVNSKSHQPNIMVGLLLQIVLEHIIQLLLTSHDEMTGTGLVKTHLLIKPDG